MRVVVNILSLSLAAFIFSFSAAEQEKAASTLPSEYHVPAFSFAELQRGQRFGHLAEALASTGLIAISLNNAAQYNTVRGAALQGICECAVSTEASFAQLEGADTILLTDGQTVRSTLATATVGNTPLPLNPQLSSTCGAETAQAMDSLRDQVAVASSTFIEALDRLLVYVKGQDAILSDGGEPLLRNSYGGKYHSVSSIVQASSNFEHFHVYSKAKKSTDKDTANRPALQLHTDAGLFLAFVPAQDCTAEKHMDAPDQSFHVLDADGVTRQVVFPPNSVAIMLGAGAENWLRTPPSLPLRAARHSVNMGAGDSRAWYGMMHLVPEAAIVEEKDDRNWTFGDMREAMVLKSNTRFTREFQDDPKNVLLEDVSIGCGFSDSPSALTEQGTDQQIISAPRRRLQHVENAGACNNRTNFYCWMSCLNIPQAEKAQGFINEGYSLYCVEPSVIAVSGKVSDAIEPCNEAGVTGLAMNTNCMGMWQPTAPGIPAQEVVVESAYGSDFEEPWCYGGTSMYMDGFHWVGSTCPIYLFPSLVIQSPGGLVLACFVTIALGIFLEWIIQRRRVTVRSYSPGVARLVVSASFYGVQLTMGYAVMLVIMIYSIPLFFSVVVGIVGGHILFSSPDAIMDSSPNNCFGSSKMIEQGAEEEESTNVEMEQAKSADGGCCHAKREANTVAEGATPCCQNAL